MIGPTFRTIRSSKRISQKEVYTGIVSRSFYQKFEKGQYSISAEKFMLLLNRINLSYDEFMFKHNNGLHTSDYYLVELFDAYWNQDTKLLEKISDELRFSTEQAEVLLGQIAFAFQGHLTKHTENKLDNEFIIDYLARVNEWTFFEVKLFNNMMQNIPADKRIHQFKKAQQFFIESRELAIINGDYANWQSYVYINFIHSVLEEEQFALAVKTVQEMDRVRSELYTSERYELAYLFMKNLVNLYDRDRREIAKISINKTLDILELVNTTNQTLYSNLFNLHLSKSERYLQR